MPEYEVVERHHIRIAAPPAITLAAAREMDLRESRIARAIFKGRELILGATLEDRLRPRGLLALVQSLGWVVLAEQPNRRSSWAPLARRPAGGKPRSAHDCRDDVPRDGHVVLAGGGRRGDAGAGMSR